MASPGFEPFSKDMESAVLGYFAGQAAEKFRPVRLDFDIILSCLESAQKVLDFRVSQCDDLVDPTIHKQGGLPNGEIQDSD